MRPVERKDAFMSRQQDKREEILVTRSSLPSYEEYTEMIKPIWDSAWLTNMGDFHKRLEKELADYMGTDKLVLFVNGHMALEMAIQALELTGEVITTPFTFASTTHAIVRNNLSLCSVISIQWITPWMWTRLSPLLRKRRPPLFLFMYMEMSVMWTELTPLPGSMALR